MKKIWTIARREFLDTVRSRAFIIGALFMPMLINVAMFFAVKVQRSASEAATPPRKIAVATPDDALFTALEREFDRYDELNPGRRLDLERAEPDADDDTLRARVQSGRLYGYLRIPEAVLAVPPRAASESDEDEAPPAGTPVALLGRADSSLDTERQIENMVTAAVTTVRFERNNPPLDKALVERLQTRVSIVPVNVFTGRVDASSPFTRVLMPIAFMLLMWMGVMGVSQGLLTTVIEEKSSRVMEVLLSAVSPLELMAGKILGLVCVGGCLMAVWGLAGHVGSRYASIEHLFTSERLLILGLYFVPTFLLFSAMLGAIGSACNTLREAQSMAFPLTLVMMVPLLFWSTFSQAPRSPLAVAMSYVPPITPFVMVLRTVSDPQTPVWQIVSTLALLWVSVFIAIWAAGRIFRVGVLMYGKPPSLRELIKWAGYR